MIFIYFFSEFIILFIVKARDDQINKAMPPKKKIKVAGNQLKITFFTGQQSQSDESAEDKLPEQRNFQERWKSMYNWQSYDGDKKLMFCTLCKDIGAKQKE